MKWKVKWGLDNRIEKIFRRTGGRVGEGVTNLLPKSHVAQT